MEFGLQVYTIRDEIGKDFKNAFCEVQNTGCKNIELSGLFDKKAGELKTFFNTLDLSVVSVMFPIDQLSAQIDQVIADCKTLGSTYVVCPYLPEEHRTDEGYNKVADILEKAAKELQGHDITLAYHNHAFEFETLKSGKCGYDILVSQTKVLAFELDVFWAQHADLDPIKKMHDLGKRLALIHLKDMNNPQDKDFCELGSGVVNLSDVISLAEKSGIPYAFVEQDSNWINDNPIESIHKSFKWLQGQSN